MFGAPFAVWTHHRGSDPGLAGGSGPPEGRELLRQESPGAGWRAEGGGGRDRWRLILNWWGDPRACLFMIYVLSPSFTVVFQESGPHRSPPPLGVFPTSPDPVLNKWATQVRYCPGPHPSAMASVWCYNMMIMFCFSIFSIPGETEEVCAVARNPGQKKSSIKM